MKIENIKNINLTHVMKNINGRLYRQHVLEACQVQHNTMFIRSKSKLEQLPIWCTLDEINSALISDEQHHASINANRIAKKNKTKGVVKVWTGKSKTTMTLFHFKEKIDLCISYPEAVDFLNKIQFEDGGYANQKIQL